MSHMQVTWGHAGDFQAYADLAHTAIIPPVERAVMPRAAASA
ncbi:hypothetical protein PATSB16_28790 [Pandoraea thiooxydans]|nr:hypothetical protein PATSB16_28790 [Pandoraea thiooxydans]